LLYIVQAAVIVFNQNYYSTGSATRAPSHKGDILIAQRYR